MTRAASWIGAIFAGIFGLMATHLLPTPAHGQTLPNPSCAKAGSDFACVAPLDGTTTQQIIVGNWGQINGLGGYAIIIENTGLVRRKICWVAPSQGSPVCPGHITQP
jgi:hypothetical protein